MKKGSEKYDFIDKGETKRYLGVHIKKYEDRSFELRQPFLIKRILDKIRLPESTE